MCSNRLSTDFSGLRVNLGDDATLEAEGVPLNLFTNATASSGTAAPSAGSGSTMNIVEDLSALDKRKLTLMMARIRDDEKVSCPQDT
jgi:hypothetical protein